MPNQRRIVIVGGVAGGATAAARARRLDENAEITLVERGPYVSYANCGLPYHISGDIAKRSALLLQTPEGFWSRYRVKVELRTEAFAIDRGAKLLRVRGPEGERELAYDALILAQGGTPFVPPIAGSDSPNVFRLWTVPDMDAIKAFVERERPASALVVGGGFIGLEAAEAFAKRGLATTVVELTDHLMPPADREFGAMIAKAFEEAGVRSVLGRSVKAVDAAAGKAILDDGSEVPAGLVLLSAGVRPNLDLARSAGLEIGPSGGLAVDDFLRTSDPSIWAAGDMIEVSRLVDGRKVRIPLAGPANRQGRIAATNALGGRMAYKGALGTSVFKAVDYSFAMTGLSEKAARDAGLAAKAATLLRGSHAGYYPGATDLALKLVYELGSGRILGAQAFGKEGVEKRIDVVATAIAGGLGVAELAELDLAYAPPYSSANDPLNMAAFAAENDLSGYSPSAGAAEALEAAAAGGALLVDLRGYGEWSRGHARGAFHLPLDEVRDRAEELPRDKELLLLSKGGFEGHVGSRQLRQLGFDKVRYVSGGMAVLGLEPAYSEESED